MQENEKFVSKYREEVQQFVSSYKVIIRKHEWYNVRCVEAKKKKDRAWKKIIRQLNRNAREEYRNAKTEYSEIRRKVERNFESDIVRKYKVEPKLFYRYISGKMKHKDGINKLKREGRIYEITEMNELMNEEFSICVYKGNQICGIKRWYHRMRKYRG